MLQDNNCEQTIGENRADAGREGEEHPDKIENERLRRRMQIWTMARKSVKGTQFNTKTSTHRVSANGVRIQWLAETVENVGTGWALDVQKVGATISEKAILWNAGNVDVTTSPEKLVRWQGEARVQILWRNGQKDYAMIKEIAWRMTERGGNDWGSENWDPKLVEPTEDDEELSNDGSEKSEVSSVDEPKDGPDGQK